MAEVRWAILGVGRAGSARAKAIRRDPRSQLVAVYRGAHAEATGAPVVDSAQAAIEAADAVAVCSPDAVHPEQVRAALGAGRHVVVEFPLAPDHATAKGLFDLADTSGRVLHVEHIELLTGTATVLRGHVRPVSVKQVSVAFETHASEMRPGHELPLSNVARLHRLVDVAGPVASIDSIEASAGLFQATLTMEQGAKASLRFEEGPYFSRRTVLELTDHQQTWKQENQSLLRNGAPQTLFEPAPLFEQDHTWAMRRIADPSERDYVTPKRMLHVLWVAQMLAGGLSGDLQVP